MVDFHWFSNGFSAKESFSSLRQTNIAIEHGPFIVDLPTKQLWFSVVMWVYQLPKGSLLWLRYGCILCSQWAFDEPCVPEDPVIIHQGAIWCFPIKASVPNLAHGLCSCVGEHGVRCYWFSNVFCNVFPLQFVAAPCSEKGHGCQMRPLSWQLPGVRHRQGIWSYP